MTDEYVFSTTGTPTYIYQYPDGLFLPVSEMAWDKTRCTVSPKNVDKSQGLTLDQNLFEVPTRSLELLVTFPQNSLDVEHAIREMRKLAEVTKCHYFAFEFYSSKHYCIRLGELDGKSITKVMPRLFRKGFSNE